MPHEWASKHEMQKSQLDKVLAAIAALGKEGELSIDGRGVRVTSPDRVLWPKSDVGPEVSKRDLVEYFVRMEAMWLRHLHSRPLTLVRMPAGLEGGKRFFQRHWDAALPDFVDSVEIYTEDQHQAERYLLADNLATLVWMAQNATMEVHTWYSRVEPEGHPDDYSSSEAAVDSSALEYPDVMVFDLDPSVAGGKKLEPKAFQRVRDTAKALGEELDRLGLKAWIKTSGKSGIHASVPLKREYTYTEVRAFAKEIGERLVKSNPDLVTLERLIADRGEKVYFDYNQNARGKSLVSVYSPRATEGAPVSFPFDWSDLESIYPSDFTVHTVPGLVAKSGDPWRDLFKNRQELNGIDH